MAAAALRTVMRAVRIERTGGPEVLASVELPVPMPKAGEVLVHNEAIGVNFIDTYQRSGLYTLPLPTVLGREGAGSIVAVGEGVDASRIGERVAYVLVPGAYAEYTAAPAARAVHIPDAMSSKSAAALMLQGLTAHYLCTSSYAVQPTDVVLIHAAAGGTGQILAQLCRARGARVIGTVSSESKAAIARKFCTEVLLYSSGEFAPAVLAATGGRGVDVVYDGVGASTFQQSLASLRVRGTMVSFGNASGPVPPVDILASLKGSKTLIRPSLQDYLLTDAEFTMRVTELMAAGLDIQVGAEFPLAKAGDAHIALESRGTTGKVLLLP